MNHGPASETLNTLMDKPLDRRTLIKIAGTYGLSSTLLGWSALAKSEAALSTDNMAASAASVNQKRYKKKPKYKLKFGGAGFNEVNLKIERQGALFFIDDLEARTDGDIQIEFFGSNQLCGQLNCIKLCKEGLVDFYASSTQNASAHAVYYNVLDFAYLWPSRAAQYYFFYHPKSEALFREPLRKHDGLQFLWTHCELRNIMLGLKYQDKPKVMTIDELQGMKLRVTGTRLGRIAMKLLGTNPIPVAWEETKTFLKAGIIDGAETWSSAIAYSGLYPAISQDVRCGFFSGNEHTAMNLNTFESLPDEYQKAVMESAYHTQVHVQTANEAALLSTVGITDPPLPNTIYAKNNIKSCYWEQSEIDKAEHRCSPKYNPEPWEEWREKLSQMANQSDIFETLYNIAREIPKETQAIDIDPKRWWLT